MVNFIYLRVFFLIVVFVKVWISLFIRLYNLCFLRNTLKKISRAATRCEPFHPSTMFCYGRANHLWELESFAIKEKEKFGDLLNVNHDPEDLSFCNDNTWCWWGLCGVDEVCSDWVLKDNFVNRHLVWGLDFRGGKWC